MAAPSIQQRQADSKRRAYLKERAEGYTAKSAWAILKQQERHQAFGWEDGKGNTVYVARFKRDGMDVLARVTYDEDPDTYDCGRFSDVWAPGAVLSAETQADRYEPSKSYAMAQNGRRCLARKPRRLESRKRTEYRSRTYHYGEHYTYWIPEESAQQIARYYNRHDGMSKHLAYLKALAQIRDQEKNTAGDTLSWYVVDVKVSVAGEEMAFQSCGGIGIDDDESYLTDVAEDLIAEALVEARANFDTVIARILAQLDAIKSVNSQHNDGDVTGE